MKKLLNSPKFWAITFGAALGAVLEYFLDGEYIIFLVGAYGAIAFADKVKDIVVENNKHKQGNNVD